MKKNIITICLMASMGILIIIIFLNYSNKGSNVKNGFKRDLSPVKAQLLRSIPFKNDNYTFVNLNQELIRLSKFRRPYEILEISTDFKNKYEYKLPFFSKINQSDGMNSVAFIGFEQFILTGNSAKAYRINKKEHILDTSTLDTMYFAQSEILSPNSFLITRKILDQGSIRRKLVTVNWRGEPKDSFLPAKQIDGYFCTDGQFRYDRSTNLLIYMFYYRGQFICLDTNLNVIYKAKTIDTVTRAKIHLKQTPSKFMTYTTPPKLINKSMYLTNSKVFIRSNLKADNETNKDFNNAEIIDVYELKNGKYLYSFYLPFLGKQKLYEFSVFKNTLVATYKNALAIFRIPEQ